MKIDILTLFPDMVEAVLGESIIGRARQAGHIAIATHNIREYSTDKHRKVDDTPFGGGKGLVMTCQPIFDCMAAVKAEIPAGKRVRTIYMSPKGSLFHHDKAKELAEYDHLILLCGHYEGVDQRVLDTLIDEEISIGDYVLTGGELPACIVADAVGRLLPGVLAEDICYEEESIACGILEYPQYTKPREFRGLTVPEVLFSGDHKKIALYRLGEAVALTQERRPELLQAHPEVMEPLLPKQKKKRH